MTAGATTRSPYPSVLRLAAPLVISFVMRSLFTFVDTIYAATLGDAAVAAIGLTIPLEFLMIAVWVGMSNGLTATLARAMGAREGQRIEDLLRASQCMAFGLVPLFSAIGAAIWFGAGHLGLAPDVTRYFQIYGAVLLGGSAFTSFWSINPDSVVKAHEDTRSTMWAGIWSNVINVILNTVFLFAFHWGIFGIAFSTVIGRFGGLAYALRKASGHEARRKATGRDDVPGKHPHPYRAILALGVPAGIGYGLMAGESTVINGLLAGLEDATAALAAYSIYYRVLMFAIMPAIATSVAMLPYAAKRFGERDLDGLWRGLRETTMAGVVYCAFVMAPALFLAGPWLASGLAEAPATRAYTTVALWLTPVACFTALPFFLCRPMFEGMQMARPGLVVAVLRYVVLTAPLAWIGVRVAESMGQPGLYGLLSGLVVATAIASAVIFLWLLATLRRLGHDGLPAVGGLATAVPEGATGG